jgi:hypothetical protein
VRGKCRRETAANRTRPRCTRWVSVGSSFSDDGDAGANSRTIPRRLRRANLAPGLYRVLITARDQAGNETKRSKRFRVR